MSTINNTTTAGSNNGGASTVQTSGSSTIPSSNSSFGSSAITQHASSTSSTPTILPSTSSLTATPSTHGSSLPSATASAGNIASAVPSAAPTSSLATTPAAASAAPGFISSLEPLTSETLAQILQQNQTQDQTRSLAPTGPSSSQQPSTAQPIQPTQSVQTAQPALPRPELFSATNAASMTIASPTPPSSQPQHHQQLEQPKPRQQPVATPRTPSSSSPSFLQTSGRPAAVSSPSALSSNSPTNLAHSRIGSNTGTGTGGQQGQIKTPPSTSGSVTTPTASTVGAATGSGFSPSQLQSAQLQQQSQGHRSTTTTPFPNQPAPPPKSASELFLQQQFAARRAAASGFGDYNGNDNVRHGQTQAQVRGQTTKAQPSQSQSPHGTAAAQHQQLTSPIFQQHVQVKNEPQHSPDRHRPSPTHVQTPQSISRPTTAPEASNNPSFSSGATAGGQPSGQAQQVQRDLQQLQLHNERQAAAAAAAAETASVSAVPGSGPSTSATQNLNTHAPITQILGAMSSNGDSNNTGAPNVQGLHIPPPLFNSTQVPGTMNAPLSAGMQAPPPVFPGNNTSGNGSNGSGGPYNIGSPVMGGEQGVYPGESSSGTFGAQGSSGGSASVQEGDSQEVGTPQIFKATYSGVPVFEMICRGVAVMRRRSDSYLNATQILKVARFDKPQRTRILEREVQKGEHEKVQGGYGKYQGTWVPYNRGVQLCQEYDVLHLLQPLLDYQVSKINSPPLAPKHITAASNKPRKPREPKVSGTPKMKKSKLKSSTQLLPKPGMHGPIMGIIDASVSGREGSMQMYGDGDEDTSTSEQDDDETHSRAGSEASMDETMSILSAQSRTPSPLESRPDFSSSEISDNEALSPNRRRPRSMERSPRSRKKQNSRPGDELFVGYHGNQGRQSSSQQQLGYYSPRIHHSQDVEMRSRDDSQSRQSSPSHRRRGLPRASDTGSWQDDRAPNAGMAPSESNQSHYADILLNYFVSDSSSLPSILINPPPDLDFDLIIDEEGHTPLHWAVAMARTKIVKLLVQHGADIYRVNNQGQTALMRSVLFTNNFDMKTFPSLLEILQKTIFTIDKNDQTVFHHVAVTAGMRGKVHASRYYMECLLDKLAQHPQELSSIINVQDAVGDTALIIAARIANKKVVRLLLEAGADPKIRNKSGRNADGFLQDPDFHAGGSSSSSFPPPPQHQHSSLPPSSSPSAPALVGQNYPQQHPAHPHHQQHRPSSSPTLQRMSHTASQQSQHYHPGALPPSASSSGSRMHGHPSPNPLGHPSSNMQAITPPPSRQGGFPLSSSVDRPSTLGYQDYPPNAPQRNSFQSQPLPHPSPSPMPHYGHHPDPNSHPSHMNEQPSGRGYPGHQNSPRLGHVGDRGVPMEIKPLSRDPSVAPGSTPGPQAIGNGSNIDNSNGRPSQRMIPAVTELLEQLTQSYEKELYEKEQDLLDARSVLHGIQTEIQEGHRSIEELRAKTMYLGQAEDQIRTLEGMIRQEVNLRQRLKLENLVQQEEARLRREMEQEKAKEQERLAGGGVPGGVDMSRVMALEKEAAELRSSLSHLQQTRKDQVEQIVQLKSQQGKRRQEYKRLVALCCNISIEDVDALLVPLLNTLGSEDSVL